MLLFVRFFFLSVQFLEVQSLDTVVSPAGGFLLMAGRERVLFCCCSDRVVSLQDYRVVVRIDSWESTSVYPNGHFVRVLGKIGDLEGEIAAILVENSICVAPFSEIQVSLCDSFLLISRVLFLEERAPLAAEHLGCQQIFKS